MKISTGDFKKLRTVARKTHIRIRIKQKCGLKAFVSKYKKRRALFLGIAVFIASCIILPQFIWIIDIEGCETIDKQEVISVLRDSGIYVGAFKGSISTPQQIRDIVMSRFDNITWAWIYINGSHAVMKIEERTKIPEITDKTQYGNIVALKDGVISKITVKEGKAAVIPGNAVMAGDTLISGDIVTKDGAERFVRALGEVQAFTYYSETQDVKLYDEVRTPTGKKKSFYTLNAFSKNMKLFFKFSVPFDEYDTTDTVYTLPFNDKYPIPLSLSKTTVSEVNASRVAVSEKTAADRAREMMEDNISKRLLPQSELINKNTYTEKIGEDTLRVHVLMEFKENIGLYQPAPQTQIQESTPAEE